MSTLVNSVRRIGRITRHYHSRGLIEEKLLFTKYCNRETVQWVRLHPHRGIDCCIPVVAMIGDMSQ